MALLHASLESLDPAQRVNEARVWLAEQVGVPFDLAAGPPFRAALLRLGEDDHVLFLAMHHIVSDGWSLGVLQRELGALYAARVERRGTQLPELTIQYADYAAWERSEAQLARVRGAAGYRWAAHLADVPALERCRPIADGPPCSRCRGPASISLSTKR